MGAEGDAACVRTWISDRGTNRVAGGEQRPDEVRRDETRPPGHAVLWHLSRSTPCLLVN